MAAATTIYYSTFGHCKNFRHFIDGDGKTDIFKKKKQAHSDPGWDNYGPTKAPGATKGLGRASTKKYPAREIQWLVV